MEVPRMAEKVEKLPIKDLTPVQKLARLDAERAEILATAKADALQKANEAVEELNLLGFHYLLCEEGDQPKGATSGKGFPNGICSICKFETDKKHDARSHKKQDPKRPFTDAELQTMGMKKVASLFDQVRSAIEN